MHVYLSTRIQGGKRERLMNLPTYILHISCYLTRAPTHKHTHTHIYIHIGVGIYTHIHICIYIYV